MMHRKTYRLFEDEERALVYEDVVNDKNQILSFKDYQSPDQTEGFNEYNESGALICAREMISGEEASRTEYTYNVKGEVLSEKLFVAGELFEEHAYEYQDNGVVKRKVQYGEEVDRYVENKSGDQFVKEFFEGSELVERHKGTYDSNTRTALTEVTGHEGQLVATLYELYDESDNLVKYEHKSEKGNALVLSAYRFENNEIVFEEHNDYINDQHYQIQYEYDENRRVIGKETRTSSGKLLEYQKLVYDDQGRLISENGYSSGSFDTIYGNYVNGENYSFEHEYDTN